ncbi:MAG: type IV secretion system DNA-binding domain-containing protein [Patescibacteria group bacterium]|jgi:hypothetical protein
MDSFVSRVSGFIWPVVIIAGSLLVLVGLLWMIRALFITSGSHIPAAFQKTILRVMVPKEHMELEERSDRPQGGMKELMAVAEALYANIGGIVRFQRWYSRLLFGRQDHIGMEIVADQDEVTFYFAVPHKYAEFVEQQIHAQYPEAEIESVHDYNIFHHESFIVGTYLRLSQRSIFPIRTYQKMESDPMSAITNVLSKVREPEGAAIQILVRPAPRGWQTGAQKYTHQVITGKSNGAGLGSTMDVVWSSAFSNRDKEQKAAEEQRFYHMSPMEEERIKSIGEKVSKVGFEVNVRIVVAGADKMRANLTLDNIVNTFNQYALQEVGNRFVRIKPRGHWQHNLIRDFIYRHFHSRHAMILNTEELTSLFHLPLSDTETPNIRWASAKRSGPPVNIPKEGLVLGKSNFRGRETFVRIKRDDRRRHFYMIGKSGVGKSNLIINMAVQDIENGEGVCVIDPHGDLIEDILEHIPVQRADDVIIFDPSDTERPVGLNMLEADRPEERDFAVQEMIAIFYKLFPPEMIGPMFEHNMRNVMLTLMEDAQHPGTITDIPRMFTDPEFQKYKLKFVTDPIVRAFWEKEMAKTSDFHKSEMMGYLISKVGRFVENRMMRNIIGQPHSGFDFKAVMNEKKILLVNLAKGKTGEVNSSLLGLIIVSKLQMAALSRADMPQEQRHDFYLYIDEFQNFITDSIATILSEARKYRLNLIIAHQYMGQLVQNQDTKIRDAVLGNAGTMAAFKIGVEDAETVSKIYAPVFNEYDLLNIEKYNAIIKLLVDNQPVRAFNFQPLPPVKGNAELAAKIKQLSRVKYGRDQSAVEREIIESSQLGASKAPIPTTHPAEPRG